MDKKKLKDIDGNIVGYKIIIPDYKKRSLPKKKMYIKSGWNKGLWLKTDNKENGRVYPCFFESFEDMENLEVE